MPKHIVTIAHGKRCEYCDSVRPQVSLDVNGICPFCRELIESLRDEYDMELGEPNNLRLP